MPIPHKVTNEFFIPSEDLLLLENEISQNPESMEQRINDLLFLFSLIDSEFERNNQDEANSQEQEDNFTNNVPLFNDFENGSESQADSETQNHETENSLITNSLNKITDPDENLSDEDFDNVEDLFESPNENEQARETTNSTSDHSNLNELELSNLLRILQRLRSQQRINEEQSEMSDYSD